jgi:hypothetical protein
VSVILPLIFLLLIVSNIHGLVKIQRIIEGKTKTEGDLKLLFHSIFYSRIKLHDKEFSLFQAIFVGIIFFISASLTSMLFLLAPRAAEKHITGILYVGSDIVPSFFIGDKLSNNSLTGFGFLFSVILLCAIISIIIGWYYAKLLRK